MTECCVPCCFRLHALSVPASVPRRAETTIYEQKQNCKLIQRYGSDVETAGYGRKRLPLPRHGGNRLGGRAALPLVHRNILSLVAGCSTCWNPSMNADESIGASILSPPCSQERPSKATPNRR